MSKRNSQKNVFEKAYNIATGNNHPIGPRQLAREIFKEIDGFTSTCEKDQIPILFQELFDGLNGRTQMFMRYVIDTAKELLKDDGTQPTPKNTRKPKRRCKTDGTRTNAAGFDLGD